MKKGTEAEVEEADELDKVRIHPFDFSFKQIKDHRQIFEVVAHSTHIPDHKSKKRNKSPSKGESNALANVNMTPTTRSTLERVFQDLAKMIPKLSSAKWRHILKELDQSAFDIINTNLSLKDHAARVDTRTQGNGLADESLYRPKNLAESMDIELLSSKIHFTDFLKVLQRESVLREILSEHQLYYHSTKRLFYKLETKLITKSALDAIHANKGKKQSQAKAFGQLGKEENKKQQKDVGDIVKIPTVTYMIDQILMFQFQGSQMILVALENQTVQVFDAKNGHYIHEFSFYNNVLTQLKHQNKVLLQQYDKKSGSPKKDVDNTSNDSQDHTTATQQSNAEAIAQKRRTMRETGIFDCPIPKYRKIVRMLDIQMQQKNSSQPQGGSLVQQSTLKSFSTDRYKDSETGSSMPRKPEQAEASFFFQHKDSKLNQTTYDLNMRENSEVDESTLSQKQKPLPVPSSSSSSDRDRMTSPVAQLDSGTNIDIPSSGLPFNKNEKTPEVYKSTSVNQHKFWEWVNDLDITENIRNLEMKTKNKEFLQKTLKKMNVKHVLSDSVSPKTTFSRTNRNFSIDFGAAKDKENRGRTPLQQRQNLDLGNNQKSIFDEQSCFDETGKLMKQQDRRNQQVAQTQEIPRKTLGWTGQPIRGVAKGSDFRQSIKSKKTVNIILDDSDSSNEKQGKSPSFINLPKKKASKFKMAATSQLQSPSNLLNVSQKNNKNMSASFKPRASMKSPQEAAFIQSGSVSDTSSHQVQKPYSPNTSSRGPKQKKKSVEESQRTQVYLNALRVQLQDKVGTNISQSHKIFAKAKAEKFEEQDKKNFQKVLDLIQGSSSKQKQSQSATPHGQKKNILQQFSEVLKHPEMIEDHSKPDTLSEDKNSIDRSNSLAGQLHRKQSFIRRGTLGIKSMDKKSIQELLDNEVISPKVIQKQLDTFTDSGTKELLQKEILLKQRADARKKIQEQQKLRMQKKQYANGGYQILGIDPIVDQGDRKQIQTQQDQAKSESVFDHYTTIFGMHENMFTPDAEKKEQEESFNKLMRQLTHDINFNEKSKKEKRIVRKQFERLKKLEAKRKNAKKNKGKSDDSSSESSKSSNSSKSSQLEGTDTESKTIAQFISKNKKYEHNLKVENYLAHLKNQKNVLWNRIGELKSKQNVFQNWMKQFDKQQKQDLQVVNFSLFQQMNKETTNLKQVAMARKALMSRSQNQTNVDAALSAVKQRRELEKQEASNTLIRQDSQLGGEDLQIMTTLARQNQFSEEPSSELQVVSQSMKNVNHKMNQERLKRLKKFQKQQRIEQDEKKNQRKIEEKKTYPLRIAYYEPENLSIFALVTREIQIHELKQTGVKYKFTHLQSLKVENIVECMSIAKHRVSGNLIICLGTQSTKSIDKSEIVIFEVDTKQDCEVVDSYRWIINFKQVTNILYKVGCGLVVTSFNGVIEIYDSKNLNHLIWSNQIATQKQLKECGSISALDYSEELDILAFGGVSGQIHFIDQTTRKHNGVINAHVHEIIMLRFYDSQHQLISVTVTGDVGLWDSQKMMKFQIMKNAPYMLQKCISSCYFYQPLGKIMLATSKIFNYELCTDSHVKIHVDQQNTIARDYLRDFFSQLKHCGFIDENPPIIKRQPDPEAQIEAEPPVLSGAFTRRSLSLTKSSQKMRNSTLISMATMKADVFVSGRQKKNKKLTQTKKQFVIPKVTEKEFLQGAYKDNTLKDLVAKEIEFNSSVLPSQASKLIASILDTVNTQLYTIDCDLMTRVWCLKTGRCLRSYMLETRNSQIKQLNEGTDVNQISSTGVDEDSKFSKKAQLAQADELLKFLIVCFEGGQIQVNNLYSGALIYNNYNVEPLRLEHEVASLCFLTTQTKYWIAASCYDGKVAFISIPMVSQGRSYLRYMSCKCSHYRDVLSLDVNSDNQLVTASIDNVLCFWNSFSGTESKKLVPPDDIVSDYKGQKIIYIKFPFASHKDLLLVVLNTGNCYMLETQSEKFLEFPVNQGLQNSESPKLEHYTSMMPKEASPESALSIGDRKKQWSKKIQQSSNKLSLTSKNYIMGRISKDPLIEIKGDVLISLNDSGLGYVCNLQFDLGISNSQLTNKTRKNDEIQKQQTLLAKKRMQSMGSQGFFSNLINFEINHEFSIDSRTIDRGGSFINILISQDHNIFLTSQQGGQIIVFNLETATRLCFINQVYFCVPTIQQQKKPEKEPKNDYINLDEKHDSTFEEEGFSSKNSSLEIGEQESQIFRMLQQKNYKRGNSLLKSTTRKEEGEIDLLKGLKYKRKTPVNLVHKPKKTGLLDFLDEEEFEPSKPAVEEAQKNRKSKKTRKQKSTDPPHVRSARSLKAKMDLSEF